MLGFVPLVTPLVPLGGLQAYVQQWLQIRWRSWMTNDVLGSYMADRAYYTIGITHVAGDPGTDNPDQRISEDIRDFTSSTLDLAISFISRITNLFSFSVILWGLSGATQIFGITIPGYMFWGAVLYAILGTWLTHLVGRKLVPLNFMRQKAEADFRYALVRLRENGEGIALSGGETEERAVLGTRFGEVTDNWFRLMVRRFKLNLLTDTYEQAAVVFPFILGAPRYFAGAIELGGLMRIVSAFSQVQRSLSWFVSVYESLAAWSATVSRLTTFQAAIGTAHRLAGAGPVLARHRRRDRARPSRHPAAEQQPVLQRADVAFRRGRSVTIAGRSGSGKSTVFRAIAGIWPFGSGTIERPPGTYLFLPQRPYLPLGTLRHAITYPGDEKAYEPGLVRTRIDGRRAAGAGGADRRGATLVADPVRRRAAAPGHRPRPAAAPRLAVPGRGDLKPRPGGRGGVVRHAPHPAAADRRPFHRASPRGRRLARPPAHPARRRPAIAPPGARPAPATTPGRPHPPARAQASSPYLPRQSSIEAGLTSAPRWNCRGVARR